MQNPMSDVEARMGIKPIEEVHAERAHLVKGAARLSAMYGLKMWDAHRKQLLAVCELKARDAATEGTRMTDKLADALAHADPVYVAFLSRSIEEAAAWAIEQDKIKALDELINRQQSVARYLAQELGLQR